MKKSEHPCQAMDATGVVVPLPGAVAVRVTTRTGSVTVTTIGGAISVRAHGLYGIEGSAPKTDAPPKRRRRK